MKENNRLLVFSLDKESNWLQKETKKQSLKYNEITKVYDSESNIESLAVCFGITSKLFYFLGGLGGLTTASPSKIWVPS